MNRRQIFLAGASAVAAACSGHRRRRIAVIPKATAHLFWATVEAGALAAGRQFDVEILWNGPASEIDYSRQIQILDSMVARRVDGIAIAAAERQALVGPIDRAVAAGIPVTVFDSGVESGSYMSWVGTDNVEAGRMAARELARLLGGKGDIAIILHAPGSLSTMDREQGFKEVIGRQFPGIRIVAEQYAMSDRAKARAAAENILSAHPALAGLFTSTEPSATGTILALKGRQLNGKVKFVTVDTSENLVEEMRAANLHAMVVQDPFGMAIQAVKTIVDKLNGVQPPKRIDLQPLVITPANLDQPDVKKLLNPDLKR